VLFSQGATDRTLYLVESGSLSVHYQDEKERLRLAIVGAGSVVGEGAFFSHRARSATVQASAPCKLWSLTAIRFTELTNRQPAIALGLAMAAAFHQVQGAVGGPLAEKHLPGGQHHGQQVGREHLPLRGGEGIGHAVVSGGLRNGVQQTFEVNLDGSGGGGIHDASKVPLLQIGHKRCLRPFTT
jgi:hypothetical protein